MTRETAPFAHRLRSDDRDEVPDLLRSAFPSVRMVLGTAPEGPVQYRQDVAGDARFSFQRMAISAPGESEGSVGEMTLVGVTRSGWIDLSMSGDTVDTGRPFIYADRGFRAAWDHYSSDLLAVHPAALDRAAQASTGDEEHRVRFLATAPVSRSTEHYWLAALRLVASIVEDPEALAHPLLRAEAFHTAVRAVLLTFPNTATMETARSAIAPRPSVVDSASAFMDAHAADEIDVVDVAAAVGSAPRALGTAFRERHGVSPLRYLRQVRLDRVRADLLAADPWGPVTVREVANRWGFASTGRFAAEYRERFGEPPSATLRR